MQKKDFNKLLIEQQVEYINSQFSNGNITLTDICKQMGIARSTVSGRFKSKGYVLNQNQDKFIMKNQYKSNVLYYNYNNNSLGNNELLNCDVQLKELIELLPKIKKIVKRFDDEKNKIIIETDKFQGNPKNRTVMVYENVLNEYIKFCDKHKELKRQDMISQALLDFINKYK